MATQEPALPIFVLENGDVGVYGSVERAEGNLEPMDVKHGLYAAFDTMGRRLKIETRANATIISLGEAEPSGSDILEKALRDYLQHLGEQDALETDCDLPCLVELARKYTRGPGFRSFLGRLLARRRSAEGS